uniref:TLC domain-containing protein n=1 Tax=Setaria digitata TaxID=48799 RepID=A0A915PK97_9BILA
MMHWYRHCFPYGCVYYPFRSDSFQGSGAMFWDERYWFPGNISWNDLKSNHTVHYPDIWELTYAMKYCFLLLLLRFAVECFIFLPIGCLFGMVKEPLDLRIKAHLGFRSAGKGKFKRVAETAWRFLFYLCIWLYGLYALSDQPQMYDISECWRNWPRHELTDNIWWYYVIQMSFYCSLIISSLLFDIRRADFIQMTLHHIITVGLLFLSFVMNLIRIGTVVLFSHDIADIMLELAKLCRYAGWGTVLKCLFVVFMIVWIVTRLIYFPFFVIWSIIVDAPALIQADYRWENLRQLPIIPRIFPAMLLCLLILHIYWTVIIVKIALKSVRGNVVDIREESDSEISSASSPHDLDAVMRNNMKRTKKVE